MQRLSKKLIVAVVVLCIPCYMIMRQLVMLQSLGITSVSSDLKAVQRAHENSLVHAAETRKIIDTIRTDLTDLRKSIRAPAADPEVQRISKKLDQVLQASRINAARPVGQLQIAAPDANAVIPEVRGASDRALHDHGDVEEEEEDKELVSSPARVVDDQEDPFAAAPKPKKRKIHLVTGNEATEEENKYCKIASLSLEPEWIEKLLAPRVAEKCKPATSYVEVDEEENMIRPAGDCDGKLTVDWVDPESHNWTSATFDSAMPMPVESGLIKCDKGKKSEYSIYTHFIKNETVAERARDAAELAQRKKPNVVVFFVDSLAQGRLERELPITAQLLNDVKDGKFKRHTGYKFNRFNVIKGGTQNNAPALLSGYCYADLPGNREYVPWLFDVFRDNGYISSIIEMDSVVGKSSLARIRTKTHSLGSATPLISWWARRDEHHLADHVLATVWDQVLDHMTDPELGSFGSGSNKLCFGGKYLHEYALQYVKDFMSAYPGLPKLLYYTPMEVHEPTMKRGATIDQDMANSLRFLLEQEDEETMIIFMGDHGLGYGPWQSSKVGRLEEKMPSLFWLMPNSLLDDYDMRDGLEDNWNKLVTAYDQHISLLELVHLPEGVPISMPRGYGKGKSLFKSLPGDRTCKDAYIPMEYCSCVEFKEASEEELGNTLYVTLAQMILDEANQQIEDVASNGQQTTCTELALDRVTEASTLMSEVMADGVEGDNMVSLRFQTLGSKKLGITPEIFSSNVYASFNSAAGVKDIPENVKEEFPIAKFKVGLNYDDGPEVFEQQGIISLPRLDDTGDKVKWARIYCVEQWDPKVPGKAHMSIRWRRPNGEIYQQSLHTLEENWTSSWQSRTLPLAESVGGQGMWMVQLWQVTEWDKDAVEGTTLGTAEHPNGVTFGELLAEREFYVGYNKLDVETQQMTPVPYEVASKFWTSKNLRRETPYAKHEGCADKRVTPDICVCAL